MRLMLQSSSVAVCSYQATGGFGCGGGAMPGKPKAKGIEAFLLPTSLTSSGGISSSGSSSRKVPPNDWSSAGIRPSSSLGAPVGASCVAGKDCASLRCVNQRCESFFYDEEADHRGSRRHPPPPPPPTTYYPPRREECNDGGFLGRLYSWLMGGEKVCFSS